VIQWKINVYVVGRHSASAVQKNHTGNATYEQQYKTGKKQISTKSDFDYLHLIFIDKKSNDSY